MADITVIAPDGSRVSFPEGTSQSDIVAAMEAKFPASKPGTGSAVYRDTRQPVTVGQEAALARTPGIIPEALPMFQKVGEAPPDTGTYIDPLGDTYQHDVRPLSETYLAGAGRFGARTLGRPVLQAVNAADRIKALLSGQPAPEPYTPEGMFPSGANDAFESGLTSATMLGGKNEFGALQEGIDATNRGQPFASGFTPALQAADERDRVLRENHPASYYGGGILGTGATAALTPVIRGGSLATRVLGNAAVQGAQGAAAGFLGSDGDLGERGQQAAIGGVLGGILGGGGSYIEPRAPTTPPPTTPLLDALEPTARVRAADRLRKIVPPGWTPDPNMPPDMLAAESIGKPGIKELGALARRDGATDEIATARLVQRLRTRPVRLQTAVGQAAGVAPEDAAGQLENMVARGRAEAAPLYKAGFANRDPMSSPTIDRLLARDAAKRGMNQARKIMSNNDVNPYTQGLTFTDDPNEWASQAGGLFSEQASPAAAGKAVSRGDSLVTFLSKQGGLSDAGGELAARNADLWHRNLPFRRRLVNPSGLDMGDAAQRALDAGYFPELGRDGTLTGSDLLAAVEAEMRGKPRYTRELTGSQIDSLSAREAEARWGSQGQDLSGDMPEYGARPEPIGGPVYEQQPTTQGLDYLIRGLDSEIAGLPKLPNGKIEMTDYARSVIATRKELRAELNRLAEDGNRNLPYVQAVRTSGDYLSAREAFKGVQKELFNHRLSAAEFARNRASKTAGEKMYEKAGVANLVFDLAQRNALKPGSWPPIVEQKLRTVLGDEAVNGLNRVIANEATMTATERAIPGMAGSNTQLWAEIMKSQDQGSLASEVVRNGLMGMAVGGPAAAKVGVIAPIMKRVGEMLSTRMSIPTRDALGQVLLGSPEDVKALLNVRRNRPIQRKLQQGGALIGTRLGGRLAGAEAGRN